jgi:hypothetical protein
MHVQSKSCPVSITASALLFATLMMHHAPVAGSHEGQAAEALTQAASDLPPAAHAPLADQAPELRAAIAGARISEPARVAGVLAELRIESAGHLGRLDPEERSELMAAMRGAGVALGDRNKLRLLISRAEDFASMAGTYMPAADGSRRVQDSQIGEGSASRPPADSATTEARERTNREQDSNAQETRMLGVSGDSKSRRRHGAKHR